MGLLFISILIILVISLSIVFIGFIFNKDTKNNNTKLFMGIFLILLWILSYIIPNQWAAENLAIIRTPHQVIIVLISSIYVIIGIVGIAKALIPSN